ncbi:MAG: NifU N-terminal domain-containing protein [Phycisphaerae bacterium]|nr:NifU N-terminal domain-containing protein [Phycisphaerae bacterium]
MSDLVITPMPTPNPNSVKFAADRQLHDGPTKTFYNAEAAEADPVAKRLFALGGVTGVMLLNDFCSVNQDGSRDWDELTPEVIAILTDAFG